MLENLRIVEKTELRITSYIVFVSGYVFTMVKIFNAQRRINTFIPIFILFFFAKYYNAHITPDIDSLTPKFHIIQI